SRTLSGHLRRHKALCMVADAQAMPLPSGSCEVVVMRQLLHHCSSPEAVVREASRVLAPGGTLFVQVPGPVYFGAWCPYPGEHTLDSLGRFSALEIERLLSNAGLKPDVRSYPFTFRFKTLYDVMKHFQGVALLERLVRYAPGACDCFSELLD